MDAERWWPPFVEVITLAWVLLFAVDVAASLDLLAVTAATASTARAALQWLLLVFLVDLVLLYRWADDDLRGFVRSHWFLILTVVPWFRPLRLLRAGRSLRALRLLARSRRVGALLNKVRLKGRSLWRRLRD
ncbi:hypothetical protein [Halolamina rubra]|uniref:hypothetical protein n=1 Tax=Halolamina rubra TaxID=1380430 RepID=UPI000679C187|nr:hypothetical protein [Halolamina rubra]